MKRRYPKVLVATACLVAYSLMGATDAFAQHRGGHHPHGHHKRGKGFYEMDRGGPPVWAPAWGYRGRRSVRYEYAGAVHEAYADDLVRVPQTGVARCNRDVIGAILGGAIGAVAGSRIGKGEGRTLATVGGAIVGMLVGGSVGRTMDRVDQNCVGQALERAPRGKTVVWHNPDRNAEYRVTPTRTYRTRDGDYCREYQTKIIIDGKVESAHGTACRQPDGTWRKV